MVILRFWMDEYVFFLLIYSDVEIHATSENVEWESFFPNFGRESPNETLALVTLVSNFHVLPTETSPSPNR